MTDYNEQYDPEWENVVFLHKVYSDALNGKEVLSGDGSTWTQTRDTLSLSPNFVGGGDRSYLNTSETSANYNTWTRDQGQVSLGDQCSVEWHMRMNNGRTNWFNFQLSGSRVGRAFMRDWLPGGGLMMSFGGYVDIPNANAKFVNPADTQHVLVQYRDRDTEKWCEVFVDGVLWYEEDVTATYDPMIFDYLDIGRSYPGAWRYLNGYIDNIRITKNVCRSPDGLNFTPPSADYPEEGIPAQFGQITGNVTANGFPVEREILAVSYERQLVDIGGGVFELQRVMLDETTSDENGDYVVNTGPYLGETLVIALEKYGEPWKANRVLDVGDRIRPSGNGQNGYVYEVTLAGESGTEEPATWIIPTVGNDTMTVGTATVKAWPMFWSLAHAPILPEAIGVAPEPWVPTQIDALELWLDADDNDTITYSTGNAISAVDDKSGNLNHADTVRGTASFTLETGRINGLPTIYCPGTGGAELSWSNTLGGMDTQTIVVVWKWRVGNSSFEHPYQDAGNHHGDSSASLNTRAFSGSYGGRHSYNASVRINGEDGFSGSQIMKRSAPEILIITMADSYNSFSGLGYYATGSFGNRCPSVEYAEVLAFNRALTTEEAELVEGYLAHKWGMEGDLPAAHPYKTEAPTYIP